LNSFVLVLVIVIVIVIDENPIIRGRLGQKLQESYSSANLIPHSALRIPRSEIPMSLPAEATY